MLGIGGRPELKSRPQYYVLQLLSKWLQLTEPLLPPFSHLYNTDFYLISMTWHDCLELSKYPEEPEFKGFKAQESPFEGWEFAPVAADTLLEISEQAKDMLMWLTKEEADRGESQNKMSILKALKQPRVTREASKGKSRSKSRSPCHSTGTISPRMQRADLDIHKGHVGGFVFFNYYF